MTPSTIKSKTLGILLIIALILSLAPAVLPATPVYAATIWYVDGALGTDDPSHGTGQGASAFKTISYAIADGRVAAGDTIIVAAGTYAENVILNKDITLRSASGSATTTIAPTAGIGIDIQAEGAGCTIGGAENAGFTIIGKTFSIQLTNAPASVLISHNTISTIGAATQGISIGAAGATGLSISNNTFNAESGDGSIWGPKIVNVTVSNNTFTGPGSTASGYAVEFAGVTGTSSISGNTIAGYGMGVAIFNGEGTSGLTISNNNITGCNRGIRLGEYTPEGTTPGDMTGLTITGNNLSTNDTGLIINNSTYVKANTFTIKYNSFTGNTSFGLNNENSTTVTAEINWWGANDGPSGTGSGTGDAVSANVDYDPWSQVIVNYPNDATHRLKGGTSYNIQFTPYCSATASAIIAYSTNGGTSYTNIGTIGGGLTSGAINTYSWSVPEINNTNCKVRVTIRESAYAEYWDASNASFTIDSIPPTVVLGSPIGGECWKGNTSHDITWLATDNLAGNLDYKLEYTTDGSNWTTISTTLGDKPQGQQTYSWTTPSSTDRQICKVRVTANEHYCSLNSTTQTGGNFTIDSTPPTASITSPAGGETWDAGSVHNIEWNASDTLPGNLTIEIQYSTDDGSTWLPSTPISVTGQAQGSKTYSWTVPCGTPTSKVQVRAIDCAGNASGWSTSPNFTIQDVTPPTCSLISPNGGESWLARSSQTIKWTCNDNCPGDMTVNLYYCTDYTGTTWVPYASQSVSQGTQSYSWTVPTPIGGNTSNACRVKIQCCDAAHNCCEDISDNNFTILVGGTPPTVTLNSPQAGDSWMVGTCQNITWNATDDVAGKLTIKLGYTKDGGANWTDIVTLPNQPQGDGSFTWAVPDPASTNCKVKITVTDESGSQANPESDPFTITAAPTDCGVETSSVGLPAGWSLISLPLIPTCTNIESVLAPILDKVEAVWYYTGGASGTWLSYKPGLPSSPTRLTTMEDGKAYWINLSGNATLTIQGRKYFCPPGVMLPTYSYVAGWNMVGYKSTAEKQVGTYMLQSQAAHNPTISGYFNNAAFTLTDTENWQPWRGCWVYFTGTGPWTIAPAAD